MRQANFVLMLHSHLPYVLNHGRWPEPADWAWEAPDAPITVAHGGDPVA